MSSKTNTTSFWQNKRVLVTGGAGFLGSHLVTELKKLNPLEVIIPRSSEYDLRKFEVCFALTQGVDIVIHLAANVGGIGYNQQHPGSLFYDNLVMGAHLMEAARQNQVSKFVGIGTICAYPKFTPIPFKEEDLWNGYPEETNAPYGLAKKMMLVQSQAYKSEYDFNSIHLLPVNLYGPGDNFNPDSSHVIPALLKKFLDAKKEGQHQVSIWGTGNPTREFLFVKDAAKGILLASEYYSKPDPVNLGSEFEISIKELAETIQRVVNYTGNLYFDTEKPDGQPRRKLDVHKAKEEFGFKATTSFEDGLQETVNWYKETFSNEY